MKIYRLFQNYSEMVNQWPFQTKKINKIIKEHNIRLIICSQHGNMRLSIWIKKRFQIPIICFIENATDIRRVIGTRIERIPLIKYVYYELYWLWITYHCRLIITPNFSDKMHLDYLSRHGTKIIHIPWPYSTSTHGIQIVPRKKRINYGIYAGSFHKVKGVTDLEQALPMILEQTHINKFYLLGYGGLEDIPKSLSEQYPDKIIWIKFLEPIKTKELIASSFFAYGCGSGTFTYECLLYETPIIGSRQELMPELEHGKTALFVNSPRKIPELVNQLFTNPNLYEKLQQNGKQFINCHDPEKISKKWLAILNKFENNAL